MSFSQTYYDFLFPHKDRISHYIKRVNQLLEQAQGNVWLTKSLKDSIDDLERKRRGYLCSAPDIMNEFFNISF